MKWKNLGKDTVIYGLGGALSRGLGFFLLPIYTRIFSTAEYGSIEMLLLTSNLVSLVISAATDSGQSFFFFKEKEHGHAAQKGVVNAVLQWRLIWGLCIVVLSSFLTPMINESFFNFQLSNWEIVLVIVSALFTQILTQCSGLFRLIFRPKGYILLSLCQTTVAATTTLSLVFIFGMTIKAYVIGLASGALIGSIVGIWNIRSYLDFSKSYFNLWPRILKFSLPLVPEALLFYIVTTADRWAIKAYLGQDELGLFAVATKFTMVFAMALEACRQAWLPYGLAAMNDKDGPKSLKAAATMYFGMGVIGIIIFSLVSPLLMYFFTAPAYHSSFPVLCISIWQTVLYNFYVIVSVGIWKSQRTGLSLALMILVALLNINLNFYLVPLLGIYGAALSTSISHLVWIALTIWIAERLWRVHYELRKLLTLLVMGCSFGGAITYAHLINSAPYNAWLLAAGGIACVLFVLAPTLKGLRE